MPTSIIGFPDLGIPSGSAKVLVAEKVANYELVDDDLLGGVYIRMNLAGPNTVTVPAGLVSTEPVHITQTGVGTTSVVAGIGVTIHSTDGWLDARTRYSSLTLIPVGVNVYDLIGDLAE
jgi:hypothetical protein